MNENLINKQYLLKELEDLLSQRNSVPVCAAEQDDMVMYCRYMHDFYLSCSTNN